MNEHAWMTGNTEGARSFVSNHEEMMADLDISVGTVREELLMDVFYDNPEAGLKVDLGVLDLCNRSEFRDVGGWPGEIRDLTYLVEDNPVGTQLPGLNAVKNGEDCFFIDSPFVGCVFCEKKFVSIEPRGSMKRSINYVEDLQEFLDVMGQAEYKAGSGNDYGSITDWDKFLKDLGLQERPTDDNPEDLDNN